LPEIRELVSALAEMFNEDWTRRALVHPSNRISPVLCGARGSWPFRDLPWLGRIASALVNRETVYRPMQELIGGKSDSTLFEMEVASWFAEASWDVEFVKRQQHPTPDLRIAKDHVECHIECKRLEQDAWERWLRN
jgi:hypothetical protein